MDQQAPSVEYINSTLGAQYDPQVGLVQQQINELPGQQQTQQSALDQAKVNAFRDITSSANSKGVLFSGVPIDQQAQYVGTKYLPAVANLNTSFNNRKYALLGQINSINTARMNQARSMQQGIQSNIIAQQKAQQDAAYKAAQLQLGYARLSRSGGGGGLSAYQQYQIGQNQLKQYKVGQKQGGGGYTFTGPGGKPLTLAQYVGGTGGDVNDVLGLLQNGSAYDRKIYNSVSTQVANQRIGNDPNAIIKAIAQQDAANYYGLR